MGDNVRLGTNLNSSVPFIAARDFLLRHREDYAVAFRDFAWPKLGRFNWALDYFDAVARNNAQPALWLLDEDGTEIKLSFAALSERSNQVANLLRELGVRRGDRILVMLGNVAPLWECMLAAMKLGAVIVPATTLLTPADLNDRFARGRVRHVIASTEAAAKFAGVPGDYTRIVVGEAAGWVPFERAYTASARFAPDGETYVHDPLLLYFTSGTTAKPKLVLHSHQSYPVGHLSTMYWLCVPATCISTFLRLVGPSMPGAASSRRGMRRRRFLFSISAVSTRADCSTPLCTVALAHFALHLRFGEC